MYLLLIRKMNYVYVACDSDFYEIMTKTFLVIFL